MSEDREHDCCPNARATLHGRRIGRAGGYLWRLEIGSVPRALVSVTYCPWCGVELNEWARLNDKPRLVRKCPP